MFTLKFNTMVLKIFCFVFIYLVPAQNFCQLHRFLYQSQVPLVPCVVPPLLYWPPIYVRFAICIVSFTSLQIKSYFIDHHFIGIVFQKNEGWQSERQIVAKCKMNCRVNSKDYKVVNVKGKDSQEGNGKEKDSKRWMTNRRMSKR